MVLDCHPLCFPSIKRFTTVWHCRALGSDARQLHGFDRAAHHASPSGEVSPSSQPQTELEQGGVGRELLYLPAGQCTTSERCLATWDPNYTSGTSEKYNLVLMAELSGLSYPGTVGYN